MGSTCIALRAEMKLAVSATAINNALAATVVSGSDGFTANRKLRRQRVTANAAAPPIRAPTNCQHDTLPENNPKQVGALGAKGKPDSHLVRTPRDLVGKQPVNSHAGKCRGQQGKLSREIEDEALLVSVLVDLFLLGSHVCDQQIAVEAAKGGADRRHD